MALISSCFPTIFSLIKHAAEKRFLRRSNKSGSSNVIGGTANIRLGVVSEKIQASRKSGFDQLEGSGKTAGDSNERLFGDTDPACSYTPHDSNTI